MNDHLTKRDAATGEHLPLVPLEAETRLYFTCPRCQKHRFRIDHIPVGNDVRWSCAECRVEWKILRHAEHVELTETDKVPEPRTLVTLAITRPGLLILEAVKYAHEPGESLEDGQAYLYTEHQCPTNFLRDVVRVVDASGDTDPHGFFSYVSTEPWRDLDAEDPSIAQPSHDDSDAIVVHATEESATAESERRVATLKKD